MRFLFQPRSGLFKRVAEVVVRECAKDHAERIGLVAQRGRARREGALACGAPPQLHDLQLFLAAAAAREVVATAAWTRLWFL